MNLRNIKIPIEELEEIPSTNSYLSKLCEEGKTPEFHTVIAERQTAGRGQRGNSWESEYGKNLTFSTVFFPTVLEAKTQFYLSMTISFAILHALNDFTSGFSIKWPNDIYWKNKKIGGILIENQLEGKDLIQSIIGIGINVNQKSFLSAAPNPISLCQIVGCDISRKELFNKIITSIISGYVMLEKKNKEKIFPLFHRLYKNHLFQKEGFHLYRDIHGKFEAELYDVEPNGYLVLKDRNGKLRSYGFKEVEFIIP